MEEISKIKLFPLHRYAGKLCFDSCTLCSGCRERVYDWDKFPRDCKVRKEVESNINKQLLPSLKWAESFGTEQLKKWIIQENKRFEALQLEHNTEVMQLNERREKVYWCSVNYLLWSDKRTIEVLNEELRKIEQAERQAAEPQQVAMKHYNSKDEEAKLKRLFEELKQEGYFDAKADVETWLYICGINDKIIPQKPLNWISNNALLAQLIDVLFTDYNKWSIASKCFTVKGETPKPNTLSKLTCTSYSSKNKKHQKLDNILKS